jgi:hypothetical protein
MGRVSTGVGLRLPAFDCPTGSQRLPGQGPAVGRSRQRYAAPLRREGRPRTLHDPSKWGQRRRSRLRVVRARVAGGWCSCRTGSMGTTAPGGTPPTGCSPRSPSSRPRRRHRLSGLGPGTEVADRQQLELQRRVERLGDGVVQRRSGTAHRPAAQAHGFSDATRRHGSCGRAPSSTRAR